MFTTKKIITIKLFEKNDNFRLGEAPHFQIESSSLKKNEKYCLFYWSIQHPSKA